MERRKVIDNNFYRKLEHYCDGDHDRSMAFIVNNENILIMESKEAGIFSRSKSINKLLSLFKNSSEAESVTFEKINIPSLSMSKEFNQHEDQLKNQIDDLRNKKYSQEKLKEKLFMDYSKSKRNFQDINCANEADNRLSNLNKSIKELSSLKKKIKRDIDRIIDKLKKNYKKEFFEQGIENWYTPKTLEAKRDDDPALFFKNQIKLVKLEATSNAPSAFYKFYNNKALEAIDRCFNQINSKVDDTLHSNSILNDNLHLIKDDNTKQMATYFAESARDATKSLNGACYEIDSSDINDESKYKLCVRKLDEAVSEEAFFRELKRYSKIKISLLIAEEENRLWLTHKYIEGIKTAMNRLDSAFNEVEVKDGSP